MRELSTASLNLTLDADDKARLASLYRKQVLVPFLGAGMSASACRLWVGLIKELLAAAKVQLSEKEAKQLSGEPDTATLIRLADRATKRLQRDGHDHFVDTCRKALFDKEFMEQNAEHSPAQTRALSHAQWPLVLTTNYDDWYLQCVYQEFLAGKTKNTFDAPFDAPALLGRSDSDCRKIISSLDLQLGPIFWALQGFLVPTQKELKEKYEKKAAELSHQIVLSHDQYQHVLNSNPLFRRAFVEVFRRRSILFMGSGLVEDYFTNLFSQAIFELGRNQFTHFVLEKVGKELDEEFLLSRLNVKVIRYKDPGADHTGLPAALLDFCQSIQSLNLSQTMGEQNQMKFRLNEASNLIISFDGLTAAQTRRSLSAVSCGFDTKRNEIKPGSMASVFGQECLEPSNWTSLKEPFLFKSRSVENLWAVVARDREDKTAKKPSHLRNLKTVMDATKDILVVGFENAEIDEIHLGLLAAGKHRKWHPIFSFAQMIRAVGSSFAKATSHRKLDIFIHVVDPSLGSLLRAGKVDVSELLLCSDVTFTAELINQFGETDSITVTEKPTSEIRHIAKYFGFDAGSAKWTVETIPAMSPNTEPKSLSKVFETKLDQFGIIPQSRLLFRMSE